MIKKILIICLTFIVFLLSSCSKNKQVWDYLDGNKEFNIESNITSLDTNNYNPNNFVTILNTQIVANIDNTNYVNLNDLTNVPSGIELQTNKIKITKGGTYIFSGNFTGNIVIEDCNGSDIRVILNGVNIESPNDSMDATIKFKETSGMRILTIADGSINTIKDSSSNVGTVADEGVIVAKKSSLTINGTGRLIINTVGSNSTGIKAKKELYLLGTNIEINALNNGIKADNKIIIKDSNINIVAQNDGIKTDMEALTETDALTYASNIEYGYMYIKNTSLKINAKDDGIVSNNALYIDNNQSNNIVIVANDGVKETCDIPNGSAIKVSGISYTNLTTGLETNYVSTHNLNYNLFINGGNFDLNSEDDAIKSKGNIVINGGTFNVRTNATSVNGTNLININNAKLALSNTLDGIKASCINLYNSNIKINALDDGITASNKEIDPNELYIYINNTTLIVDALGKGLDSNGYILMDSGNVVVNATAKDIASVNSNSGIVINGGNFIALGDYGMVENPSSSSNNKYINFSYTKIKDKNTIINIYDGDNIIYSITALTGFYSVVISSSSFSDEDTTHIEIGNKTYNVEFKNHSMLIEK